MSEDFGSYITLLYSEKGHLEDLYTVLVILLPREVGWGRRIRTPAHGFRVHCPTARLSPNALEIISFLVILWQYFVRD
jgi:hypothetical protein